jgi:hypothetical protein
MLSFNSRLHHIPGKRRQAERALHLVVSRTDDDGAGELAGQLRTDRLDWPMISMIG